MTLKTRNNKRRNYPFKRQLNRKVRRIIFMLVAAVIATGINYYNTHYGNSDNNQIELSNDRPSNSLLKHNHQFGEKHQQQTLAKLHKAKDQTNSRLWLGLNATVIKLLKDDLKGSRHQKFLIQADRNLTLLVSHNIDLAPRVPLKVKDRISLQGRYEWNNRGGVIHWTHHDPKGKKAGGWISLNGKKYK